ncbi:TetR/AcrR family transcriptional regulator [Cellulomonas fimi]|uniref:TetR/AcrR family transcriptional regulator n=1 Tax=Cellulomonas fimi TaxID=1708 RepID=A0A7Y0LVH8_CELFI|nr:TetR/AcrR family transcriptional regulator [Cellulomonas fimi]NMR18987.1 TetR/AcrR family transcriptional regulator [Cellulomonas fimi]
MSATTESRRDRQRTATEAEIKAAARAQLVETGAQGVSLRGIARQMGMTAPALYRYYSGLDNLLEAMCEDCFAEVTHEVATQSAASGDDLGARLHLAVRAFRRWAVAHPAEFGLMFRDREEPKGLESCCEHSRRFAEQFLGLFVRIWAEQPFELPDEPVAPEAACAQLREYAASHGVELPMAALWVFASSWVRLFGVICMEVFGQLAFMFRDVEPYFEAELRSVVRAMGIEYVAPDTASALG